MGGVMVKREIVNVSEIEQKLQDFIKRMRAMGIHVQVMSMDLDGKKSVTIVIPLEDIVRAIERKTNCPYARFEIVERYMVVTI